MTLLVLALLGLMVLVVTVSPPDPSSQRGAGTATATPQASPVERLSDPDAFDVEAVLSDGTAKPKRIKAVLGDRVQITVQGRKPDSVALGDLRTEQVEAGLPARFELLADTPGTYPLVLVDEERRIGTLEIR